MKQPTLDELKRRAEDLEMEIHFLEDELSSKQNSLDEVHELMEKIRDPEAYAQEQEDIAAYERQVRYLRKRYGPIVIHNIRDYWIRQ